MGVFARRHKIPDVIRGLLYVVGDNVDTEQILPARYATLNPSRAEERRKFGWYAFAGLPESGQGLPKGRVPFTKEGQEGGRFPLVVAGKNFGCGTSGEGPCIALSEAGVRAVIAEYFASVFCRHSLTGGYLIPCETQRQRLCDVIETGMEGELILANVSKPVLHVAALKTSWTLGPLAEASLPLEGGVSTTGGASLNP